jgi:hypothetical protein
MASLIRSPTGKNKLRHAIITVGMVVKISMIRAIITQEHECPRF